MSLFKAGAVVGGAAWAIGSTIAAPILLLDHGDSIHPVRVVLGAIVMGVLLVGVPTMFVARRCRSSHPQLEGLVAAAIVSLTVWTLLDAYTTEDAREQVNDNTTASMRRRQASFDRWGVAPEVAGKVAIVIAATFAAAVAVGVCGALVGVPGVRGLKHAHKPVIFGFSIALAVLGSVGVVMLTVAVLPHIVSLGFRGGPFEAVSTLVGFATTMAMGGTVFGGVLAISRGAVLGPVATDSDLS